MIGCSDKLLCVNFLSHKFRFFIQKLPNQLFWLHVLLSNALQKVVIKLWLSQHLRVLLSHLFMIFLSLIKFFSQSLSLILELRMDQIDRFLFVSKLIDLFDDSLLLLDLNQLRLLFLCFQELILTLIFGDYLLLNLESIYSKLLKVQIICSNDLMLSLNE